MTQPVATAPRSGSDSVTILRRYSMEQFAQEMLMKQGHVQGLAMLVCCAHFHFTCIKDNCC